jgi:hypothetical protein
MFLFLLFVASSLILLQIFPFLLLKCLLASLRTLFRVTPFLSLGSCNNSDLACSETAVTNQKHIFDEIQSILIWVIINIQFSHVFCLFHASKSEDSCTLKHSLTSYLGPLHYGKKIDSNSRRMRFRALVTLDRRKDKFIQNVWEAEVLMGE